MSWAWIATHPSVPKKVEMEIGLDFNVLTFNIICVLELCIAHVLLYCNYSHNEMRKCEMPVISNDETISVISSHHACIQVKNFIIGYLIVMPKSSIALNEYGESSTQVSVY